MEPPPSSGDAKLTTARRFVADQHRASDADAPPKCPVKKARQYVDRLDKALTLLQDVERANADNPFLQGNFAPVESEQPPTSIEVVEGAIPADFPAGCYLRIGPNPMHGPRELDKRVHWFDGHGMIHSVCFPEAGDGETPLPKYSSSWLETDRYKYERDLGKTFFMTVSRRAILNGRKISRAPSTLRFPLRAAAVLHASPTCPARVHKHPRVINFVRIP